MDFLNASRATLGLVTAGGGPGTVEDPSELLKYILVTHHSFRVFVFETRCGAHNLPLVLFLRRGYVAAAEKPFLSCLLLRPCFRRPRPLCTHLAVR